MTVRDPKTGVPILGAVDPQQQYLDRLRDLRSEKANLAADDHDWIVIIQYNISTPDAIAITKMKETGHQPVEPIALTIETMRADSYPTCARCGQTYDAVATFPCPGMTIEEYIMSLDDETRDVVMEKLRNGEAVNMADPTPSTTST